ncbi:glycoside hydrolase family 10 protein [Streptomyces pinistramenti]|uniref:glycoside hydrolase family 10 protein n=1 Tax=Streptomyces pinistramenti TaxID=2884812 RepID=UPI001D064FFF|nr:family 10 glycosylhydrolase [Streptomyces pinistramenti]MCB5911122.1 family 10 glycosylhydrolase [Streptomyces pinistramenti]
MRRITRRGFTVAALGAASSLLAEGEATATGRPGPRKIHRELRGMWLATVARRDWPSAPGLAPAAAQRELLAHLDTAAARRLNAVFFQVRPTADALWPSPYEPWSDCLTGRQGRDPGWDPLGFAVREAHRRGLELHAWFNPYRVAHHTDRGLLAPTHPVRRHPAWALPYGGELYYNPGLPRVRRFVQDAIMDAVRRYAVDGVHFDDYFYPYPVAGQTFDDDAAYAAHGGGFADRAAWRRANTDLLVRELSARIAGTGRRVRFGVSPFAVWRNRASDPAGSATRAGVQTYDDLYADTRRWVREGWIDYVAPQAYWNLGFEAADYAEIVRWWARTVAGTGVDLFIGEALYKAGDPAQPAAWQDPAELSRHLTFAGRYPQVGGHIFFSAKEVAADRSGAMARVVADHYGKTASRPPR